MGIHGDQLPPGDVCHMCQSLPSWPIAKASTRPSRFVTTDGLLAIEPPSEVQFDQAPPGDFCRRCVRVLSPARANASSRPSVFTATAAFPLMEPPKVFHWLVVGTVG